MKCYHRTKKSVNKEKTHYLEKNKAFITRSNRSLYVLIKFSKFIQIFESNQIDLGIFFGMNYPGRVTSVTRKTILKSLKSHVTSPNSKLWEILKNIDRSKVVDIQ